MPFEITSEVLEAAKQHALEAFPNEACGFVMPEGYLPVENVSSDPENRFELSPTAFIEHQDALAFIHSHPVADAFANGRYKPGFFPFCPSGDDMRAQIAANMVFGIVVTDGQSCYDPFFWGDFILDEPIYDRPFRHGVEDCYSIIRKWFWQNRGIKLPDFARDPDWWETDANLYLGNFPSVGFQRLGGSEVLQEGDCGLIQIGNSSVRSINHAFVYLGDGTVCQHLPGRLSSRDAMGGRMKELKFWVRHQTVEMPVQGEPMVL